VPKRFLFQKEEEALVNDSLPAVPFPSSVSTILEPELEELCRTNGAG